MFFAGDRVIDAMGRLAVIQCRATWCWDSTGQSPWYVADWQTSDARITSEDLRKATLEERKRLGEFGSAPIPAYLLQ